MKSRLKVILWHYILIGQPHINRSTLNQQVTWVPNSLDPTGYSTRGAITCWIQRVRRLRECQCDVFYHLLLRGGEAPPITRL